MAGVTVEDFTIGDDFAKGPKFTVGEVDVANMPSLHGQLRPVLAATVELMALTGGRFQPSLDAGQWQAMATFLEGSKLIAKPVAASDAFSNAYATA